VVFEIGCFLFFLLIFSFKIRDFLILVFFIVAIPKIIAYNITQIHEGGFDEQRKN